MAVLAGDTLGSTFADASSPQRPATVCPAEAQDLYDVGARDLDDTATVVAGDE